MKQTKNGSKKFSATKVDIRFFQVNSYKYLMRLALKSLVRQPNCSEGIELFTGLYFVKGNYQYTRNSLITENMGLVYSQVSKVMKQQRTQMESFMDLVGIGSIGLIIAVDKFMPYKGNAFSSFAVPYIYGNLQRHYRDKGCLIRLPQLTQSHAKKFKQFASKHSGLEISELISVYVQQEKITKEQLTKILEEDKNHHFYSLENQYVDDATGVTLQNSLIIENDETCSIDYRLSWKDTKKYSFLKEIINKGWLSLLTAKTDNPPMSQENKPRQLSLFSS